MKPIERDDLSRFLVHLTRDYESKTAEDNLISILQARTIEARNAHCLFHKKFDRMGFSKKLRKSFNTVCLTEIPFSQLRHLATEIEGRKIELKPYGLVFRKDDLLKKGASPALYINAKGTVLRDYLIGQFDQHFLNRDQYQEMKADFGADADSIIQYYSLINVMSDTHDFSWEREWRYLGDLDFDPSEVFAILAEKPTPFAKRLKDEFSGPMLKFLQRTPIISPHWNVELIIEKMSLALWNAS